MSDRLLDMTAAGAALGGLHPSDVRRLGRDGKLDLVKQVVRGRSVKPRLYVRQSELDRYIRELPPAGIVETQPVVRRRGQSAELRREIAAATQYV